MTLAASAQSHCRPIQFPRGTTSTVVDGIAPAEGVICYTLAAGEGQTANLKIVEGKNTIFSIDDLVDAQDRYSFTTQHKAYKIVVGQLTRSNTTESFRLTITIK